MASVAKVEIEATVRLKDRKATAALMVIQQSANEIVAGQPWNDDAKRIARLSGKLLKRIDVRTVR